MNNWATSVYKSITTDKGEEIPWRAIVYIKTEDGEEFTASIADIESKELLLFFARDKENRLKDDYYKIEIANIAEMRQIELEESYGQKELYSRRLGIKADYIESVK
jgi:hypothetical protein